MKYICVNLDLIIFKLMETKYFQNIQREFNIKNNYGIEIQR